MFNKLYAIIKVFTRKEHPLVIFLDDLQWVDLASLNLIKLMITSPGIRYLFIIGAYRDNEVSPSHSLMLTIEEINGNRRQRTEHMVQDRRETDGALPGRPGGHYNQHCSEPRSNSINCESSIVNTLSLAPLDLENVNKLIAGALRCAPAKTISLPEQLYQKTG